MQPCGKSPGYQQLIDSALPPFLQELEGCDDKFAIIPNAIEQVVPLLS